ncbi:Disease resistance protein L6 [Linum perenne]
MAKCALEYEIFLSFRGPDVRKSFADSLYSYLVHSIIRTFKDEEELRTSLVQAITESKIYIPILSKSYASSKWCLQELAKMVECCKKEKGHIILPVFYFVDRRDGQHQTGPYEEAFEQHSKKHDPIIVQEWRAALQEVGQVKGWHVTEIDGYLGRAIVIEEDVKNPWKRSSIWSYEDACNMLKNAEGTDQVGMLRIDMGHGSTTLKLTEKAFEKLAGLNYLDMTYPIFTGDFSGILPDIRWLRLHQCRSLPTDLNLDLQGCHVTDDWRGWSGIQVTPRNSTPHKHEVPKQVNKHKDLEELCFMECDAAPEIPGDIWQLTKLKTLNLCRCRCNGSLLVDEDDSLPSSLTSLILAWCWDLNRLLNLGNLNNLVELQLIDIGVTEIHGLESLQELESLTLESVKLTPFHVHAGLWKMAMREDVDVPLSFRQYCSPVKQFPDLSHLQKLKKLYIMGWRQLPELTGIESLTSLKYFEMTSCESLRKLTDLSGLKNLENLDVNGCVRLVDVMGFGRLESLQRLFFKVWPCPIYSPVFLV